MCAVFYDEIGTQITPLCVPLIPSLDFAVSMGNIGQGRGIPLRDALGNYETTSPLDILSLIPSLIISPLPIAQAISPIDSKPPPLISPL